MRAVFKGEVLAIIHHKRANPTIVIRHGSYITSYSNLKKIYVKKGEKIDTKQEIGEVFTDAEGESILKFSILKNNDFQNPAEWIYKM